MHNFVIWDVDARYGTTESFIHPQSPGKIADKISRRLTVPTFLDGETIFSIGVRPLPEGARHPEDVPKDAPERQSYIQAAGSSEAMTIEIRVPDVTETYIHYVVARHPISDPNAWTSIYWNNGNTEPSEAVLHPEEVFTGEQAVPVFRDYILNNKLPSPERN